MVYIFFQLLLNILFFFQLTLKQPSAFLISSMTSKALPCISKVVQHVPNNVIYNVVTNTCFMICVIAMSYKLPFHNSHIVYVEPLQLVYVDI